MEYLKDLSSPHCCAGNMHLHVSSYVCIHTCTLTNELCLVHNTLSSITRVDFDRITRLDHMQYCRIASCHKAMQHIVNQPLDYKNTHGKTTKAHVYMGKKDLKACMIK